MRLPKFLGSIRPVGGVFLKIHIWYSAYIR